MDEYFIAIDDKITAVGLSNQPYFSLVSDNTTNELRVGLKSCEIPEKMFENTFGDKYVLQDNIHGTMSDGDREQEKYNIEHAECEISGDDLFPLSRWFEKCKDNKYTFINY